MTDDKLSDIDFIKACAPDFFEDAQFEVKQEGDMIYLCVISDTIVGQEFVDAMHGLYEFAMTKERYNLYQCLLVYRRKTTENLKGT